MQAQKGTQSTPAIRAGLSVQELKAMTAMRMAQNGSAVAGSTAALSSNPDKITAKGNLASSYQTATPQQLHAAGISAVVLNGSGSSSRPSHRTRHHDHDYGHVGGSGGGEVRAYGAHQQLPHLQAARPRGHVHVNAHAQYPRPHPQQYPQRQHYEQFEQNEHPLHPSAECQWSPASEYYQHQHDQLLPRSQPLSHSQHPHATSPAYARDYDRDPRLALQPAPQRAPVPMHSNHPYRSVEEVKELTRQRLLREQEAFASRSSASNGTSSSHSSPSNYSPPMPTSTPSSQYAGHHQPPLQQQQQYAPEGAHAFGRHQQHFHEQEYLNHQNQYHQHHHHHHQAVLNRPSAGALARARLGPIGAPSHPPVHPSAHSSVDHHHPQQHSAAPTAFDMHDALPRTQHRGLQPLSSGGSRVGSGDCAGGPHDRFYPESENASSNGNPPFLDENVGSLDNTLRNLTGSMDSNESAGGVGTSAGQRQAGQWAGPPCLDPPNPARSPAQPPAPSAAVSRLSRDQQAPPPLGMLGRAASHSGVPSAASIYSAAGDGALGPAGTGAGAGGGVSSSSPPGLGGPRHRIEAFSENGNAGSGFFPMLRSGSKKDLLRVVQQQSPGSSSPVPGSSASSPGGRGASSLTRKSLMVLPYSGAGDVTGMGAGAESDLYHEMAELVLNGNTPDGTPRGNGSVGAGALAFGAMGAGSTGCYSNSPTLFRQHSGSLALGLKYDAAPGVAPAPQLGALGPNSRAESFNMDMFCDALGLDSVPEQEHGSASSEDTSPSNLASLEPQQQLTQQGSRFFPNMGADSLDLTVAAAPSAAPQADGLHAVRLQ